MMIEQPSKEELEKLAQQIKEGQRQDSPAEKRVKIKSSFKKAVKKMGQTPPPQKEAN